MPMKLTDNPNIELENVAYSQPFNEVHATLDELESYDQFINFSDPPKTPEEIANEFGSPLEPNYVQENYYEDIDGIAFSDPNDLEPPIHFYGRTEEDAMEALFEEAQVEEASVKANAADETETESAEENNPSDDASGDNPPQGTESTTEPTSGQAPVEPAPSDASPTSPASANEDGSASANPPTEQQTATPPVETEQTEPPHDNSEAPAAQGDTNSGFEETTHVEENDEVSTEKTPPAPDETVPTDPPEEVNAQENVKDTGDTGTNEKTTPASEGSSSEENADNNPPQADQKTENTTFTPPKLLCPHCGKKLYVTKSGDEVLIVHSPADSKNCPFMYNSIEEIQDEIAKMQANKAKLNRMIQRKKQEALEKAKLTAEANRASQNNKVGYDQIFTAEPVNKTQNTQSNPTQQQVAYDPELLRFLNSNVGQILQNQGVFEKSIEKEISNIQKQQDKIIEVQQTLTQEISAIKENMGKIDVNGANQKLEELTVSANSTMEEMSQMKKLSTVLGEQSENLTQGVTDMLSATRNAGEQFAMYSNSVRKLQATDVRLRTMLPYLEKYMEETDERYEGMINRYGEIQKQLGDNFKAETEKFFKEAKGKISKQLNVSGSIGSSYGFIGYICSFVAAFLLMMVFNIMK